MDISAIFDQQTMDAIVADAKASGISADEVSRVLGSLTDQNLAPTRSVNSAPELMSLLDDDQDAVVADVADATGIDRSKTSTILMLAAPFLLKYLFSGSGSSNSNSGLTTALLSSLLGGAQQTQTVPVQQPQQSDLLSLFGGAQQPQQQPQQSAQGGGLLNALFNLLGDNG